MIAARNIGGAVTIANDPVSSRGAKASSKEQSRARRTLPADERRQALLTAATSAFLELGYEATRISDIVARAKVAQGTFYLYFPTKAAVYLAITGNMTAAMFARTTAALEEAPSFREAIDRGIDASFDVMTEQREMLTFIAGSPLLPEVRRQTSEMGEKTLFVATRRIREAVEDGLLANSLDPEVVALLIHGAVDFVARQYLQAERDALAHVRAETRAFVYRALGLPPPA